MENTGIYKRLLLDFLITQNCKICVEYALRIKRSWGVKRGKSDKIDARRIAEYAVKNEDKLTLWSAPRKSLLILKDLLITRERLQKVRTMLEVPIEEMRMHYPKDDINFIESFSEPIVQKDAEMMDKITYAIKRIALYGRTGSMS
jgi:transposase